MCVWQCHWVGALNLNQRMDAISGPLEHTAVIQDADGDFRMYWFIDRSHSWIYHIDLLTFHFRGALQRCSARRRYCPRSPLLAILLQRTVYLICLSGSCWEVNWLLFSDLNNCLMLVKQGKLIFKLLWCIVTCITIILLQIQTIYSYLYVALIYVLAL